MVRFGTGTSPVLSTGVDPMAGVIVAAPISTACPAASTSQMVTSCSPPSSCAVGFDDDHHQSRCTLPSIVPLNGATQYVENGSSAVLGSSSTTLPVCVRSTLEGPGWVVSNVAVGVPEVRFASSLDVPWNQKVE